MTGADEGPPPAAALDASLEGVWTGRGTERTERTAHAVSGNLDADGGMLRRNETLVAAGYVIASLLDNGGGVVLVGEQVDPLEPEFDVPGIGRVRVRVLSLDGDDVDAALSCVDRIVQAVDRAFVRCDECRGACQCVSKLRAEVRRIAGIA